MRPNWKAQRLDKALTLDPRFRIMKPFATANTVVCLLLISLTHESVKCSVQTTLDSLTRNCRCAKREGVNDCQNRQPVETYFGIKSMLMSFIYCNHMLRKQLVRAPRRLRTRIHGPYAGSTTRLYRFTILIISKKQ